MTLDDLKAAWHDLDRKLTATRETVLRVQTDRTLDRARSALRPLVWRLTWELLEGVAAAGLFGWYLGFNWEETRFAVPGLILFALAVLSLVSSVWQLAQAGRIDYAEPVAAIQARLADLRAVRVRTGFWVLILSPLLWALLLVVGAKGLLGADLYAGGGLAFVLANLGFGVAFLAVAWGTARHWAARSPESAWRNWLADGLAGRALTRAGEHVREAKRFRTDEPGASC